MTDKHPRTRPQLRLMTMAEAEPLLKALDIGIPESTPKPGRAELRRAAEGLVELCAQVLLGRHPLAAVRRRADGAAFAQFAALYRRYRPGGGTVSLRLRHSAVDASGALTMVAMLRVGKRARAVSLCARRDGAAVWRLTRCRVVEPG